MLDIEHGPGLLAGLLVQGPLSLQALGLLVVALVAAVLGAVLFRALGVESDLWLWGLLGGLVHGTIAAPAVTLTPSSGPATVETAEQKELGALDVVTSLVGHLGLGVRTGALYGCLHSRGRSGLAS